MNINWKIRIKNKTFWITFIPLILSFLYNVLGLFNIIPKISQDNIVDLCLLIVNTFAALGIIIDPTTTGLSDSARALNYNELNNN